MQKLEVNNTVDPAYNYPNARSGLKQIKILGSKVPLHHQLEISRDHIPHASIYDSDSNGEKREG